MTCDEAAVYACEILISPCVALSGCVVLLSGCVALLFGCVALLSDGAGSLLPGDLWDLSLDLMVPCVDNGSWVVMGETDGGGWY